MKLYNKKIDLLNYLLILEGKKPIFRYYKIHIKKIGCNAKCKFCEDWKYKENKKVIIKNLYKVFYDILKDNIKYKKIQILGGEPLLIFDEINKIIKIGSKNNIVFDFPTNASLLNLEKIDKLLNSGLKIFTFSLDFPNDKHNKFRNLPNTFEKICTFTKYLKEKKIKVQWNTIVGKFNLKEIINFQNLYNIGIKPDIHNFIEIENNGGISIKNFLENYERKKINNIISNFEKKFKNITFIKNGFSINNKKEKRKHILSKNNLCFIPLKTISYYVDEKGFSITPCYYDTNKKIKNIEKFIKQAITNGCTKCNSSYKAGYNNYMLNLIKKYKLSNK